MKKTHFVLALAFAVITSSVNAQDKDPVVMTINDRPIKKSEFEAVYRKNNGRETSGSKSVREYVDLFSLFKSKVFEAESLGLDTLSSFRNELAGYRRQLAAPYLTDKNTNESLITEAHERMKQEVKASHILIRLDEKALPKDTLEAWTRTNMIRNTILGKSPTPAEVSSYEKLLKNTTEISKQLKTKDSSLYKNKMSVIKALGEISKDAQDKFPLVAARSTEEPSGAERKGELPWFTAFDMVYPFETAAYNTKVGELSNIIRTRFGYHIIKVYDRRDNRGEMTAAHIMVLLPKKPTDQDKANAKTKIDEIYAKLKGGQSFEELARQFSDDKQTSERGGQLQPFKGGRLPKAFEDAAFALSKNGDYSEPVLSPYGWHIIKRIDHLPVRSLADMKNELKTRVQKDARSQKGREALIARVKQENNFKENLKNRDEILKVLDTTYKNATWKADRASKLGNKEIFNLAGKSYTQMDFAKFMESQMSFRPGVVDLNEIMRNMYRTWVDETVVNYEDAQLEKKYPDFANLYREYRDGILLFDLTDQKVWGKAVKDTAGLRQFYESHKNNYMWDERAEVTTYKCLNEKVAKDVRKLIKAGKDEKQIIETINKPSQLNVSAENVTYLKGENKNVDANWKQGVAEKDIKDEKENKVLVLIVNKILPKSPKTLGECRGNATADYQSNLDTEWISYLRNKYKVKVNEDVLGTIK
jgi:peptidyl-prolyl cis-trans isomerase SurA